MKSLQIYEFTADFNHRDRFAGNADLIVVDRENFRRDMVYDNAKMDNVTFKFRIQNAPLARTDMLSVEGDASNLLILSNKMLNILEKINRERIHCVPAFIAGVGKSEYSVVQAPVLDIFDWEHSEYDKTDVLISKNGMKWTGNVDKYVFTIPNEELPVIFRIQTAIGPVFMREDVRDILREEGIRGISYKRPGKFSKTNQFITDIPTTV